MLTPIISGIKHIVNPALVNVIQEFEVTLHEPNENIEYIQVEEFLLLEHIDLIWNL